MADEVKSHRFRFSVPVADVSVNEWIELQDNPSVSLRYVVRYFMEREGMVDPTCVPVEQLPKRGRPRNDERKDDIVLEVSKPIRATGHVNDKSGINSLPVMNDDANVDDVSDNIISEAEGSRTITNSNTESTNIGTSPSHDDDFDPDDVMNIMNTH